MEIFLLILIPVYLKILCYPSVYNLIWAWLAWYIVAKSNVIEHFFKWTMLYKHNTLKMGPQDGLFVTLNSLKKVRNVLKENLM